MPPERKRCCISSFFFGSWNQIFGPPACCIFPFIWDFMFFVFLLQSAPLHAVLGITRRSETWYNRMFERFTSCSSYNISLKAFRCPGGNFWRCCTGLLIPLHCFIKGYSTTTPPCAHPAINSRFVVGMLRCWYMHHGMITFVTAARLLFSWRGRTHQSHHCCCLYLEQCSVEHLIRRSPNNSDGFGIVCDWCGFVTPCVCVCVWERERGRGRESRFASWGHAAGVQSVWIIDKWIGPLLSAAVNHRSSFRRCQYPAFNSVCVYAYFIKSHVLLMHGCVGWCVFKHLFLINY